MKVENNSLLNIIPKLTKKQQNELVEKIYTKISDIHTEKKEGNWLNEFSSIINLSLFDHGLSKKVGLKDYILIDYLKNNLYQLKGRAISKLIRNSSLLEIEVRDGLEVNIIASDKYGDKILDYVELNVIAYYYPELADKLLNKLIQKNSRTKFLKLYSIYSAKYIIDLILAKENFKDEEEIEFYDNLINFIIDSFEDFTSYKPSWYKGYK